MMLFVKLLIRKSEIQRHSLAHRLRDESADVLKTLRRGLSWGASLESRKSSKQLVTGNPLLTRRGQIHSRLQPSYHGILVA